MVLALTFFDAQPWTSTEPEVSDADGASVSHIVHCHCNPVRRASRRPGLSTGRLHYRHNAFLGRVFSGWIFRNPGHSDVWAGHHDAFRNDDLEEFHVLLEPTEHVSI